VNISDSFLIKISKRIGWDFTPSPSVRQEHFRGDLQFWGMLEYVIFKDTPTTKGIIHYSKDGVHTEVLADFFPRFSSPVATGHERLHPAQDALAWHRKKILRR